MLMLVGLQSISEPKKWTGLSSLATMLKEWIGLPGTLTMPPLQPTLISEDEDFRETSQNDATLPLLRQGPCVSHFCVAGQ